MKQTPASSPKKGQPAKQYILLNGYTGEEKHIDPRKTKILDGIETGDTVTLDDGTVLEIAGEGKYHTQGRPQERWGEVISTRPTVGGSATAAQDAEFLGWSPLFRPRATTGHKPTTTGHQPTTTGRKQTPTGHKQTAAAKNPKTPAGRKPLPAGTSLTAKTPAKDPSAKPVRRSAPKTFDKKPPRKG